MKFKNTILTLVLICTFSGLTESCSDTDCPLNNVVRCYYTLYSSEQGSSITYSDTISVYAANTTLLNKYANATSFNLPMSYALQADTLTFEFRTSYGVNTANVIVSHTNTAHFVSLDCPTSFFHTITDIKHSAETSHPTIDSIVVIKPEVNYDLTENIRIYLSNY